MKTNQLTLCGLLAGLIAATASTGYAQSQPPANSAITWTTGGKQSKNVDVLFVQNAKNVTIDKGKLVLRGVNPVTVCFTDRPARLAGHMPTSKFVPLWSQGKDSFLKDNPNATLSIFQGDKVSDFVVELSNPRLSGNDLSYDVKVLEGTLLAKREPARCSSISLACRGRPFLSLVPRGGASAVAIGRNSPFTSFTSASRSCLPKASLNRPL